MTKQAIIDYTVNQLPEDEAMENLLLTNDLTSLASGKSFDFLHDEEDLYTEKDIKIAKS